MMEGSSFPVLRIVTEQLFSLAGKPRLEAAQLAPLLLLKCHSFLIWLIAAIAGEGLFVALKFTVHDKSIARLCPQGHDARDNDESW